MSLGQNPEQSQPRFKQLPLFQEENVPAQEDTLPVASVAPPKAILPAPPPPAPSTYWVVLEERRAALNGALVTVAKGKVVKNAKIAARLREQNVPLEEKNQ